MGLAGGQAAPYPWGSCRFAGIHFQESDLSFEQNLNVLASAEAPDLTCFPEAIKQPLPYREFDMPPSLTKKHFILYIILQYCRI